MTAVEEVVCGVCYGGGGGGGGDGMGVMLSLV